MAQWQRYQHHQSHANPVLLYYTTLFITLSFHITPLLIYKFTNLDNPTPQKKQAVLCYSDSPPLPDLKSKLWLGQVRPTLKPVCFTARHFIVPIASHMYLYVLAKYTLSSSVFQHNHWIFCITRNSHNQISKRTLNYKTERDTLHCQV